MHWFCYVAKLEEGVGVIFSKRKDAQTRMRTRPSSPCSDVVKAYNKSCTHPPTLLYSISHSQPDRPTQEKAVDDLTGIESHVIQVLNSVITIEHSHSHSHSITCCWQCIASNNINWFPLEFAGDLHHSEIPKKGSSKAGSSRTRKTGISVMIGAH